MVRTACVHPQYGEQESHPLDDTPTSAFGEISKAPILEILPARGDFDAPRAADPTILEGAGPNVGRSKLDLASGFRQPGDFKDPKVIWILGKSQMGFNRAFRFNSRALLLNCPRFCQRKTTAAEYTGQPFSQVVRQWSLKTPQHGPIKKAAISTFLGPSWGLQVLSHLQRRHSLTVYRCSVFVKAAAPPKFPATRNPRTS